MLLHTLPNPLLPVVTAPSLSGNRGDTIRQACVAEEAFVGINDHVLDSSLSCRYAWLKSNFVPKRFPHFRVAKMSSVLSIG